MKNGVLLDFLKGKDDNYKSEFLSDTEIFSDEMLKDEFEHRNLIVKYSSKSLKEEIIDRGEWPTVEDFDDELLEAELENRDLHLDVDLTLYKSGMFSELLEQLERRFPLELAGISKKRLV